MSENRTAQPSLPAEMPALAVLGLAEPENGDWNRLHGLQFSHLARMSRRRVGLHAAAVVLALSIYALKAPWWLLLGWTLAVAISVATGVKGDLQLADADRRRLSRTELNNKSARTAGIAGAWSAALIGSLWFGGAADQAALWLVIAMLITGSALALGAAPLGTIIFAGITGLAAVASFLIAGQFALAAAVVGFLVVAMAGTIEVSRIYLKACIAEAGVAEKSEVVSLLLREFEENQADWLWQIDTNRMVRKASPRFAFALGRTPEEVEGVPFLQLVAGEAWDTGQFAPSLHDLAENLKRRENFSNL
ncbi:MAG: diguanylate cyclase, partial [Tsuneonella sp.]